MKLQPITQMHQRRGDMRITAKSAFLYTEKVLYLSVRYAISIQHARPVLYSPLQVWHCSQKTKSITVQTTDIDGSANIIRYTRVRAKRTLMSLSGRRDMNDGMALLSSESNKNIFRKRTDIILGRMTSLVSFL